MQGSYVWVFLISSSFHLRVWHFCVACFHADRELWVKLLYFDGNTFSYSFNESISSWNLWFGRISVPVLNSTVASWFSGGLTSSGFEVSCLLWLVGDGCWAAQRKLCPAWSWDLTDLQSGQWNCWSHWGLWIWWNILTDQREYLGSRFCSEMGTSIVSPTASCSNSIKWWMCIWGGNCIWHTCSQAETTVFV